ncbi:MAG TPA: DUF4124 domain-containing protein [Usitatibacter sp.]|nr:DUF4124 domain-containing protein [Usitatibacter sp.]
MRNSWLGLAMLAFATSAAAVVYKWVDANGVTHYSEMPPENIEAQQVPVRPGPSAEAPAPGAAPNVQQVLQQADEERESIAAKRKLYCDLAQRAIVALEADQPVAMVAADGAQVLLNAEQRATALADARRRADKYCDATPPAEPVNP